MNDPYYIIAIDPSLNNTGICVARISQKRGKPYIEVIEVAHIPNKQFGPSAFGHKLKNIERRLYQLRDAYRPMYICKENLAGLQQAEQLAPIHALVHMTFAERCEISGYAPTTVKKVVTGDGSADKDDVAQSVQLYLLEKVIHTELNLTTFLTDDCSDALAILITYLIDKQIIGKLDKR